MQQFVVPQFIDVEDKIMGPITIRQFLILLGSVVPIFLAWRFGDAITFIVCFLLFGGIAVLFAFIKVNGQLFHVFLLNVLITARKPSLRLWNKSYTNQELEYFRKLGTENAEVEIKPKKEVKQHHVRNLSLIVNTGGYYKGEDDF